MERMSIEDAYRVIEEQSDRLETDWHRVQGPLLLSQVWGCARLSYSRLYQIEDNDNEVLAEVGRAKAYGTAIAKVAGQRLIKARFRWEEDKYERISFEVGAFAPTASEALIRLATWLLANRDDQTVDGKHGKGVVIAATIVPEKLES